MTWTYLQARSSLVVGTPTPATTQFAVTAATGARFQTGPATVSGYTCTIAGITGDLITLATPLPFAPATGDELVQSLLTDRDQVRLLIGDTDASDPQLQDEEIAFLLGQDPAPLEAAIAAADTIAAKYARMIDTALPDIKRSYMQLQKSYERLADRLRRKIARRGILPYVGGTSLTQRCTDAQDTDLVQPVFERDMETEPGTGPASEPRTVQPFPFF